MREIKFRAWDKLDNSMMKSFDLYKELNSNLSWETIREFILMQFTGLKDKNGKEIYEGDIVKNVDIIGEIKFEKSLFLIGSKDYGDSYEPLYSFEEYSNELEEVEVIGNIYENPELLEEES